MHASLLPGSRQPPQGPPLQPVQSMMTQPVQRQQPRQEQQQQQQQPQQQQQQQQQPSTAQQSAALQPSLGAMDAQLQPVPPSSPATWHHLSCWTDAQSNFASDAGFVALAETQRRDGGCFRLHSSAHAGFAAPLSYRSEPCTDGGRRLSFAMGAGPEWPPGFEAGLVTRRHG